MTARQTSKKPAQPANKPAAKAEQQPQGGGGGGTATVEKPSGAAAPPATPPAPAPQAATVNMPGTRKPAGEDHKYSYAGSSDGCRSQPDDRSKVLDLFMANPTEVFDFKEVAAKADISQHKAWCSTRDLEDMEDLVEAKSLRSNKKGHRLHPNLAKQIEEERAEQAKAKVEEEKKEDEKPTDS